MNPLAADLDHVLSHTTGVWEELRNQRIFITGGTGFFGRWLLESFAWANDKLRLGATAVVLTRNPEDFINKAPHLARTPAIRLVKGNLTSFEFPAEKCSHVIHAAVESTGKSENALLEFENNIAGTQRVLQFAGRCEARKFLFTSSGGVYGRQPPELTHISEEYAGAPLTTELASSYGEAKRACEYLCAAYAAKHNFHASIARCFAFVGPHLPMNLGFAIGNFIRDAMRGGPIQVNGDGTPFRSYLYAADLTIWLWQILFRGQSGRPYNVGSDEQITIAELAQRVVETVAPGTEIRMAGQPVPERPAARYVPSIERARRELSLDVWVNLVESIRRTVAWQRATSDS